MLTKELKLKAIVRLRFCLVMACIVSGLLAGVNVERYLVRMPAWRQVDILLWAEFTRFEYLGNGFYLYQAEAALCFICLIISSVLCFKNELRFVARQVYFATIMVLAAIVLTFFAASPMFSLNHIGNDPVQLQQVFDEFHYWGAYRAVAQILSFFTCVWAMGRCFVIRYAGA